MDDIRIKADVEAADHPTMLVKCIEIEAAHDGNLREQAAAIVAKIDYLGSELKVIEVDGVSNAVQIRSRKPSTEGFIEIVLRAGKYLSLERKGEPLRMSKADYERLIRDLREIL